MEEKVQDDDSGAILGSKNVSKGVVHVSDAVAGLSVGEVDKEDPEVEWWMTGLMKKRIMIDWSWVSLANFGQKDVLPNSFHGYFEDGLDGETWCGYH